MAFIIDTYNKCDSWDRAHATYIFQQNGAWYAVKAVELEWGIPVLPTRTYDNSTPNYQVYATERDALAFVHQIKQLTYN